MRLMMLGEIWRLPPLCVRRVWKGNIQPWCRHTDLEGSMTTFGAEEMSDMVGSPDQLVQLNQK